ncbi:unnamed protein product [Pylaiella littoralis]
MVRTTLWARWWTITLISQVLTRSCCAIGVLQTKEDGPGPSDVTSKAGAAAGGGGVTTTQLLLGAAARRCVALDDSGHFPANRALGLFETEIADRVDMPRTTTPVVTSASVEFVVLPSRRREGGGGGSNTTLATRTVRTNMMLDVDDQFSALLRGLGTAAPAHDDGSGGDFAPTKEKVEIAAAAAVEAVADNPAEAPVAISALAAWNLATTNGVKTGGAGAAGAAMKVRVEVAAAFGYHGDWYTTSKDVTLVDDGHGSESGGGGSDVSLSTSFDWQPTGDVWVNLDEPAVADVKVYSNVLSAAHPGLPVAESVVGSTLVQTQEEQELVLLQATLCKRATSVSFGSRAGREGSTATGASTAASAAMQATLMTHTGRKEYGPPQQPEKGEGSYLPVTAGSPAPAPAPATPAAAAAAAAAAAGPSGPVIAVSEIQDGKWWKAHEEKVYGRGMDTVNALPRLRNWKPGDWKKRRKRRRRQDEERERRRTGETAYGRADRGGRNSGFRRSSDRDSVNGRRSAWRAVKGAWRAVGRMWRRSARKFRRGKTKK